MNGHPESLSVLVVCDGNLCRSPSAQYALATALPDIRVESAGRRAVSGAALCRVVAGALSHEGDSASDFVDGFRSRKLAEVSLANYDLVLAATVELRGELARSEPPLRDRFFTLREADAALSALLAARTGDGPLDAQTLVATLNEFRWATGTGTGADAAPRGLAKGVDPGDIPDAHGARDRRHRATVQLCLATARSIASSLAQLPIK